MPYANGPLHIGHLAGVYVPADLYVRYLRSNEKDVVFIGGSDEHGVPITIKAWQQGVTPQDIVDKYHELIKKSFAEFGISFDIYSRTSNKIHHETSSEMFKKMYDEGKFIENIPSNIMTSLIRLSFLIVILSAHALFAVTKRLMATSAKIAAHHLMLPI